jgi:subtilisin family serine protease
MKRKILTTLLVATFIILAITSQTVVKTDAEGRDSSAKSAERIAEFIPGEVIVRFREDTTAAKTKGARLTTLRTTERDITAEVKEFDGSNIVKGLRVALVAPADTLLAVQAFKSREDVLYAEPNYVRRKDALPNDPSFASQWGLKNTGQVGINDATGFQQAGTVGADIDAELAWNITTGSRTVVVGVVDEGVDITHTDLIDNIWRNPGEIAGNGIDDDGNGFKDDINGWDFYHNDASVYDGPGTYNSGGVTLQTDSHGTHVAGTIGATGNNATGVTGVNWQVSIMSLKIIPKECTPIATCDPPAPASVRTTVAAYNYARMMRQRGVNLRVLNNSYGGGGKSQAEIDAISALNDVGILFVASAGNEPEDSGTFPRYPSTYDVPNIIAVAATNRFDDIASFSTFGARTVSIGAPGRSILSTFPSNTYASISGTSMSTPHVAGTAALVVAANPGISAQNLRGVLAYTGDVLPALQGKTTTGRRLNAYNALVSAAENDTTAPAPVSDLRITAQDGRTITFAWTAVGDDGNSGRAADYDFVFTNSTTGIVTVTPASLSTLLPGPAGSQETATVAVPYRNFAGTVELRVYDNAGNVSKTPINVTISVNSGSDPYQVALSASSALSTGGTGLNLIGDDKFRENYPLPFAFPFFGVTYNSITVSTNGALYFSPIPRDEDDPTIGTDASSLIEELNRYKMIAGMWDDLRTDRNSGDVFVISDADRIIFRWVGATFNTPLSGGASRGENPINFEIELRRDGTIQIRYGNGNTRLFPVVGVSDGEPDAYVITSHTSEQLLKNLTNAQTVTFSRRTSTPRRTQYDFNGASRAVVSVFRPSSGTWYLQNAQTGYSSVQFGQATDKIVPADYDGDGRTDVAVYRAGTWFLQRSQSGFASIQFGAPDDIPVPADYDADGKAELAVFRPSNGTWYVLNGTTNQYSIQQWGTSTDKPVVADYDGDGKADYAVYRPSNGTWYLLRSRDGFAAIQWGEAADKPVVGDYDGDGKADTAVYRPSNGTWYLLRSRDGFSSMQWGEATDSPVPADYDGDGRTDIAVYRPSNGTWYLLKSTEGFAAIQFGDTTDRPIPSALVP